MGQQQSSETSPSEKNTRPKAATVSGEKEKKINRRTSIPALSHGRASPIDPSPSKDNATAQSTSHHVDKPNLQQYLHSSSPEHQVKDNDKTSTPPSRSRDKRHDLEHRPRGQTQSTPSEPVSVPAMTKSIKHETKHDEVDEHKAYQQRHYTPISQLRPPRLPLPIADAGVPDSPALPPMNKGDADVPVFEEDEPLSAIEPKLRRKSSMLSTTTLDEQETTDELQVFGAPYMSGRVVPTVIDWPFPGEKVYVTGTFANWDKKYRLHRKKDGTGMATTINLPPGTHHLAFLVDDKTVISENLPTAVDFNNYLVNYIEISNEDVQGRRTSAQRAAPYPAQSELPQELQPPEVTQAPSDQDESEFEELGAEEMPPSDFRQIIPQALVDIDMPEDDSKHQQAIRVLSDGVGPPSLPMFLSRSILNGVTPVKDDSSVLTLPNHTVLNHMMTSSVKNNVLATSVTHRYKKKYVTTISFKPVPNFNNSSS